MSTDYSKMSDQEINMAIARMFFPDDIVIESRSRPPSACITCSPSRWVDYCNNPADAWPIIVANNIDIIQDNGQGCALATNSAIQMFQGDDVHISQDENPLRAAMIVFLMMQESKNAS